MSYAQLIKLEDQADYYGSMYDQSKTSEYIKGGSRISKILDNAAIGEFLRVDSLQDGDYRNPDRLLFASAGVPSQVSSLTKIGSNASFIINSTPAFVTLTGLSTLSTTGTWFVADAPNGKIIATNAPVGAKVRIGMSVSLVMTFPMVITEQMFQVIHIMPQSGTSEVLFYENVTNNPSATIYLRSSSGSAQARIESNLDYFEVRYASLVNSSVTVQGIELSVTVPI